VLISKRGIAYIQAFYSFISNFGYVNTREKEKNALVAGYFDIPVPYSRMDMVRSS